MQFSVGSRQSQSIETRNKRCFKLYLMRFNRVVFSHFSIETDDRFLAIVILIGYDFQGNYRSV